MRTVNRAVKAGLLFTVHAASIPSIHKNTDSGAPLKREDFFTDYLDFRRIDTLVIAPCLQLQ